MTLLRLDNQYGLAGDMLVGALLDAGASWDYLSHHLMGLNLEGLAVFYSSKEKDKQRGIQYWVDYEAGPKSLRRNFFDIEQLLSTSELPAKVRDLSSAIFKIAAHAGAKAHQCAIEQFFFHEAGALDSIADIVGFCLCYVDLGLTGMLPTTVVDGSGSIQLKSGRQLPVPVPAVRHIIEDYDLSLRQLPIQGELTTPTGAAILAGLMLPGVPTDWPTDPVIAEGIGFGKRTYNPHPYLKIQLIDPS